ncbi:MAG: Methyltransferase type 11 [Acidimicrobiaceae bacterium]|nr:Methyltransferase type 11 [Acidimicrobiaceae bacterium]
MYDRRDQATGGFLTDWLDGVLNSRSGETAIDLGCGTGNVAAMLAERYTHVRAIDLSQPMIDLARRKHGDTISFEQGDLTEVTGQYDLVVSIMTLHHVPDLPAALEHISELVAPRGLVILIDNVGSTPIKSDVVKRWTVYRGASFSLLMDVLGAWRRFRVRTDRRWVDHLLSDHFLSEEEFAEIYGGALPGAVIRPKGGLYTAVWKRPGDAAATGEDSSSA